MAVADLDKQLYQQLSQEAASTGAVLGRGHQRTAFSGFLCPLHTSVDAFGRRPRTRFAAGQRDQVRNAGSAAAISRRGVLRRCRGAQLSGDWGDHEYCDWNGGFAALPWTTKIAQAARRRG